MNACPNDKFCDEETGYYLASDCPNFLDCFLQANPIEEADQSCPPEYLVKSVNGKLTTSLSKPFFCQAQAVARGDEEAIGKVGKTYTVIERRVFKNVGVGEDYIYKLDDSYWYLEDDLISRQPCPNCGELGWDWVCGCLICALNPEDLI